VGVGVAPPVVETLITFSALARFHGDEAVASTDRIINVFSINPVAGAFCAVMEIREVLAPADTTKVPPPYHT